MVLTKYDLERERRELIGEERSFLIQNELDEMRKRDPIITGLVFIGITTVVILGSAILGGYIEKKVYETNVNQKIYSTQGERK